MENDCCLFEDIELCDSVAKLPVQYQCSEKAHRLFIKPFLSELNCLRQSSSLFCSYRDCSELTGDALTAYGDYVGFPRCQCGICCGDDGEACIDDDELYCRLIKSYLASLKDTSISTMCEVLDIMFGESSFVISSSNGLTEVSSGRPLTEVELKYLPAIKSVLPHHCATRVDIFDIEDFSEIVGVNCGDCNNFTDACGEFSGLCNPIDCPSNEIDTGIEVTEFCIDVSLPAFTSSSFPTSDRFSGQTPTNYFIESPSVGILINPSTGIVTIQQSVPSGTYATVVTVTTPTGFASCSFDITLSGNNTGPLVNGNCEDVTFLENTPFTIDMDDRFDNDIGATYSLTPSTGMSINPSTGIITSSGLSSGSYPVTVIASGQFGSDECAFNIIVTETSNPPTLNSCSDINANQGQQTFQDISSRFSSSTTLSYAVTSGPFGVTINSTTGVLGISSQLSSGTYPVDVTATNASGSVTCSFDIFLF